METTDLDCVVGDFSQPRRSPYKAQDTCVVYLVCVYGGVGGPVPYTMYSIQIPCAYIRHDEPPVRVVSSDVPA